MAAPTIPMSADSKDCKLHNTYSAQFCVFAGVCVILGGVICFFGYRLFKFIMFLAGFIFGFFLTYILCHAYLTEQLSGDLYKYKDQLFLGIAAGVGLIAGLLTLCLYYVGLFILGASMGWFLGMALLPLMQQHSEYLSDHHWLPYLICAVFAIAGGIFILIVQRVLIILSTAFIGAFLTVNGLDYFLENGKVIFYAINVLHGRFEKSMLPSCWYTWVVLALIPVMFVAGAALQFVKTSKTKDHREAYGRGKVTNLQTQETQMEQIATGDQNPILAQYA